MKLEEFQETFDYAPFEIEEFAVGASKVDESPELAQAAKDYLNAEERFRFMLSKHGVTIG